MPIVEPRNVQFCSGCTKMMIPDASDNVPRCSRCKFAYYCDSGCQKKHWKAHKPLCKPPPALPTTPPPAAVLGVRLLPGNNPPLQPESVTIPADHPSWAKGTLSPVSTLVDMPLLIYKEVPLPRDTPRIWAERECQVATFMMIDLTSGFAPPRWQDDIGPALVVRADQKPLTVHDLARFWSYCCKLMDMDWGSPAWRPKIIHFLRPEVFAEIEK